MSIPDQINQSEEVNPPVLLDASAVSEAKNTEENAVKPDQEPLKVYHIMGFKKSWEEDDVTYDYMILDGKNNLRTFTIPICLNAKLFEPCSIEMDQTGIVSKIIPCPNKKPRDEIVNGFFENIKTSDIEGTEPKAKLSKFLHY